MSQKMLVTLGGALVASQLLVAQPAPPPPPPPPPPPASFVFIGAGADIGGATVAGKPYTAEGVNETVRILGDGTKITQKNTTKFARDGQGRTRIEHSISALGPWSTGGDQPASVVRIADPVAGEVYLLDEKAKTATKMKMGSMIRRRTAAPGGAAQEHTITVERHAVHGGAVAVGGSAGPGVAVAGAPVAAVWVDQAGPVKIADAADVKTESLGKQTIEGLVSEGTRTSRTIPAGTIGNDRPLTTTTEVWFSPEIETTVKSITKDPQMGEITYRLTNVQRGEPAKYLFQVPADYKIEDRPNATSITIRDRSPKQ